MVRGVRGVGKSALLLRLQGGEPPRAYAPTPEIKTAHIAWSSRASSDAVKVEVWDVVDHALREEKRSRRGPSTDDEDDRPAGLPSSPQHNTWQKTLSTQGSVTIGRLDAQIVDVYKGAQSVVLVFDATKVRVAVAVARTVRAAVAARCRGRCGCRLRCRCRWRR